MGKSVCCAWTMLAAVVMAAPCFAAESPWNGTWKVNEAKSKFTGNTFTISEKGNTLHYANGGPVEYDFACDGKEYHMLPDRTVACTKSGQKSFEFVYRVKGQETARSMREISADGKSMNVSTTGSQQDGSRYTDKATLMRVAGAAGLVGTWKSTADIYSGTEIAKITLSGNVMRMEYPSMKESVDAKLDGTSVPVLGPTVPPGVTFEMKADGPLSVHYVSKLNGKVTAEGIQTVTADGKTMTDTSWTPGKTSEKTIAVYDKQ